MTVIMKYRYDTVRDGREPTIFNPEEIVMIKVMMATKY